MLVDGKLLRYQRNTKLETFVTAFISIGSSGSQLGKKKIPKRNSKKKLTVNKSKENILSVVALMLVIFVSV